MTPDDTIDAFLRSVGPEADPTATWGPAAASDHPSAEPLPSFETHTPGVLGAASALQLGEVLGEGGMGVVFSAHQAELDRHVAVKQLKTTAASHAARALTREARVMGRLDHPNIIPVHALGKDGQSRPVMVMKRVDGVSWRALIRDADHPAWSRLHDRGTTAVERHLSIFLDVCRAVAHAHDRGTLHLDLKPDNVMIGEHGEVYVVDWGLAAPLGQAVRAIAGTPAYMAPEQTEVGASLTEQTDVFLLGATLFEALTGRPPRQGDSIDHVVHLAQQAPPLSWPPGTRPSLRALVQRACSADVSARTPSVNRLISDTRDHLRHAGSERLAEAALERAQQLKTLLATPSPDPIDVNDAYSAARFGLEQALLAWPENPRAREGLGTLLRQMVEWSCSLDEAATAAGTLATLEQGWGPHPDLHAAVAAIDARQQQRLANEHAHDLRIGYGARMTWIGSLVVFGLLVLLATQLGVEVSHTSITLLALGVTLCSWAVTGLLWRRITANDVSRRIVLTINLTLAAPLLNRLAAISAPEPPPIHYILAVDLVSIGLCGVLISVFTEPWLIPACTVAIAAAAVAAMHPELSVLAISSGAILMPIGMVLTLWWRRDTLDTSH